MRVLEQLLQKLPASATIVLVDNGSETDSIEKIRFLVNELVTGQLVVNNGNLGLAAAVNQGVRWIREHCPDIRFVLLLDQDSEPLTGSVKRLVQRIIDLEKTTSLVGCVGPNLLDPITGLSHGFHQCTRWRWLRVHPLETSSQPIPCATLNGSGTLVSIDLFCELGGLDETLFIDHVDTEWSFRVTAAGYALFGIPDAHFIHRMGESSRRIWLLGWRVWPLRSPQRHYYLFRNTMILMRRDYVPKVWKFWSIVKLVLTALIHGVLDDQRKSQLRYMWSGVCDGVKKGSKFAS
jgi:rhamnosyltransferase